MKIFISSVIDGFAAERDAAAAAVRSLGHEPARAEDFPAAPDSPQAACLAGARTADVVVLILGARYGYQQASGLSATHEEYRESRDTRPVLAFIQRDIAMEPEQEVFLREVQGWEKGHYTASFGSPDELRDRVTRAIHDYTLASEVGPLDPGELLDRARALIPQRDHGSTALLTVSLAPGPTRAVLRPAELEASELTQTLLGEALTGELGVLTTAAGTHPRIHGDRLELAQPDANRLVALDETGRMIIARPVTDQARDRTGIASIIEEDLIEVVERALRFYALVLDLVDPVNRLTHVAPVVALTGAGYMPWRTRQEQLESPNRATINMRSDGLSVVSLSPPVRRRPALNYESRDLAEDLIVRLRREVRS